MKVTVRGSYPARGEALRGRFELPRDEPTGFRDRRLAGLGYLSILAGSRTDEPSITSPSPHDPREPPAQTGSGRGRR
jgi:hypothetical protein